MASTPAEMPAGAAAATVVKDSTLRRGWLFLALIALFVFVLYRDYTGAQTTAGRVAGVAIMGVFVVLGTAAFITVMLRHSTIEVSSDAIVYTNAKGDSTALPGEQGPGLRVIRYGPARRRQTGLTSPGSGTIVPLFGFDLGKVERACLASGWRFPDGTAPK